MTTFKTPSTPSEVKQGTPINTTDINVVGRTHEPVEKYSQDIQVGDILQTGKGSTPFYKSVLSIKSFREGKTFEVRLRGDCTYFEIDEKVWVFVPYINKPSWYTEPSEHHYWKQG